MNRVSKTNLRSHSSDQQREQVAKTSSSYSSHHLNPVVKEKSRQEFVVDWQVGNVHANMTNQQTKHFF